MVPANMTRIEQLRNGGQLPSPKGVALAIMNLSRREDATLHEISRVVQCDPALSGRLLRLANASTRLSRPLVSINEAVLRQGMATVKMLAMGFSLVDQYSHGTCRAFDYQRFWSHSLFMAVASQELARVTQIVTPDELFACGLLAQIGQLALATVYPDDYAAILEQADGGTGILEREQVRLGINHVDLGAAILADCGIPKVLAESVYFHEAPETSGFSDDSRQLRLTQLLCQARHMADLGLSDETGRNNRLAELKNLGCQVGLETKELGEVYDRALQHWREWGEMLKLPAANLPSFADLVAAAEPVPAGNSLKRVLLVEDEPTTRIMMEGALRQVLGCAVYTAENGRDALALALEIMPQIIITDILMPVMDGLEFCRILRATEWGRSMYVIMLTCVENEETIVEAFEAGVDDYVSKPVSKRALSARMQAAMHYVELLQSWEQDRAHLTRLAAELSIGNRRLEHVAMTDLLTGLPNRRAGMDALDKAWSASLRTGKPLAVLMIDVDRFKSINDHHGHAVGDVVLQSVARCIHAAARNEDNVSRIGGEEFLLVCQNADHATAHVLAERLRKAVAALEIEVADLELRATVSIGVASRESVMMDAEALVRAADHALYAAKNDGRNQVSCSLRDCRRSAACRE